MLQTRHELIDESLLDTLISFSEFETFKDIMVEEKKRLDKRKKKQAAKKKAAAEAKSKEGSAYRIISYLEE